MRHNQIARNSQIAISQIEKNRTFVGYFLFPYLAICLLAIGCFGGETAAFLKIPVGVRAVGMGSAYTALANDISSIYWNPAGLSSISSREIGAMHAELFAGTRYEFFGYAQAMPIGALAGSMTLLTQDSIEGRDKDRNSIGAFQASDQSFAVSFSRPVFSGIPVGMSVKFIQSSIAGYSANTIAFDLGLQLPLAVYHLPVSFGFSIQNLSPGMKFAQEISPLPLTASVGIASRVPRLAGMSLTVDLKHRPHESKTQISFGSEFPAFSPVILRAGYSTFYPGSPSPLGGVGLCKDLPCPPGEASAGGGEGYKLVAGVGFLLFGSQIDYAFLPMGELGSTHRFSLTYRW